MTSSQLNYICKTPSGHIRRLLGFRTPAYLLGVSIHQLLMHSLPDRTILRVISALQSRQEGEAPFNPEARRTPVPREMCVLPGGIYREDRGSIGPGFWSSLRPQLLRDVSQGPRFFEPWFLLHLPELMITSLLCTPCDGFGEPNEMASLYFLRKYCVPSTEITHWVCS